MTSFSVKEGELMKVIMLILFIFTVACAATNQAGGSSGSSSHTFTITYPEKWIKLNTKNHFMFTKDGPFKQYIMVRQRHVDKPYTHTDKLIRRGMSSQQAAEVILDAFTSDPSVLNFKLIENVPVTVNRYDGFRIACTYGTPKGYQFKVIYYGFLVGEWLYGLRYNAAEEYYSEKDVETFRGVLNSLKIK